MAHLVANPAVEKRVGSLQVTSSLVLLFVCKVSFFFSSFSGALMLLVSLGHYFVIVAEASDRSHFSEVKDEIITVFL